MKNRTLRIGLIVAILTLVTSCFMGSTFAKYVTNGAGSDQARVAKWGVFVTAAGDLDLFDAQYATDDTTLGYLGTYSVKASNGDNLLAPGTKKDSVTCVDVSGTPEVAVDVVWTCEVTLDKWAVDEGVYCPIIFTVNIEYDDDNVGTDTTTEFKIDETNTDTVKLEAAIEKAITDLSAKYDPNTDLGLTVTIGWKWLFSTSDENDVKDTELGDAAQAGSPATISISMGCKVTQID